MLSQPMPPRAEPPPIRWGRSVIAVLVVAAAYYFIDHSFTVSQYLETLEEEAVELDELVASGSGGRRAGFALLGFFGTIAWFIRGRADYRPLTVAGGLLLAYFAWCFASVLWADDREITVRRLAVLVFLVLATMGLSRQFTARELCWFVVGVASLHMLWGVYAEVRLGTFRPWAADYRFAGTLHPNSQGVQLAALILAVVCLTADMRRGRGGVWILAAAAAVLLVLTKSRTSCGATLLGLAAIWLPSASRFWKAVILVFLPTVAVAGCLIVMLFQLDASESFSEIVLLGRGEEAGTLTGRIPLWIELSHYARERPWQGYGYGSFWNVTRIRQISESQGWQIAHSHSAYLETVLNVGLIGAALLFIATVVALGVSMRRYRATGDSGYRFVTGFTMFAALYSVTDAGFALPSLATLIWMCGLAVVAFAPAPRAGSLRVASPLRPRWHKPVATFPR